MGLVGVAAARTSSPAIEVDWHADTPTTAAAAASRTIRTPRVGANVLPGTPRVLPHKGTPAASPRQMAIDHPIG